MADIKEIVNGYIGNDMDKVSEVLYYIENTKREVKGYAGKVAIGGTAVMLLGMILTNFMSGAFAGVTYIGFMALGVAGGMFVENFIRMSTISRPVTVRQDALEYITGDTVQVRGTEELVISDDTDEGESVKEESEDTETEEPEESVEEEEESVEEEEETEDEDTGGKSIITEIEDMESEDTDDTDEEVSEPYDESVEEESEDTDDTDEGKEVIA